MSRRSHINGLFAKLAKADRPFIRSLSPYAQAAIVELTWDYWPDKTNPTTLSERGLADMLGCHRNTARTVLRELCERGFLVRERRGTIRGAKDRRAAVYRKTWLEVDSCPGTETFDYRKKSNGTKTVPSTAQETYQQRHKNCAVETGADGASEASLKPRDRNGLSTPEAGLDGGRPTRTYSNSPVLSSTLGQSLEAIPGGPRYRSATAGTRS